MAERRFKDAKWTARATAGGQAESEADVYISLAMDLRDELKEIKGELRTLRQIFHCTNFLALPCEIQKIRRRVCRKKRKAKPSA